MKDRLDKALEHHIGMLKDHQLTKLTEDGGLAEVFRLTDPRYDRMMSTDLIFGLGRIWICGDYSPRRHGVVSCVGYSLNWFVRQDREVSYLGEKFLEQRWTEDRCKDVLDDMIAQEKEEVERISTAIREEMTEGGMTEAEILHDLMHDSDIVNHRANIKALERALEVAYMGQHAVADALEDRFMDEDVPGWGYGYNELATLCAIQRTFSRLYRAMQYGTGAAPGGGA